MGTEWTRDEQMLMQRVEELDKRLARALSDYQDVEDERDAAVARAEKAEKRHTWPKVTPTGHTYVEPRTYEALRHEHDNAAQAAVESWDADECPPEPTWEMVGIAHREVERLQRECDEMRPSYDESVSMAYWAAKRLGCHVDDLDDLTLTEMAERVAAQPAPAVSRADIEKAVADWVDDAPEIVNEVWSLVSGSDPAVYVVRESDLPAARVDGDYYVVASAKGDYKWPQHGPSWWAGRAQDALAEAARYTALARLAAAREADPAEAKARELYRAATPDARWETVADEYRRIARHVLGK